jgi:protein ImuA
MLAYAFSMSSQPILLQTLLESSRLLWKGGERAKVEALSTGYPTLDARLPGGGWPLGSLIEIIPHCAGLGELTLLLPALRAWAQTAGCVALVQPPHIPYAPAFAQRGIALNFLLWVVPTTDEDGRWAAEQLLREGAAAVLLWSCIQEDRALRRLQLAAEAGKSCAFLYRPPTTLTQSSPAAVRIALSAGTDETNVDIVKVRGGRPARCVLALHPLSW